MGIKKQRTARLVSLILVASLLLSTACYVSYATGAKKSKAEKTSEIGEILDGIKASGKEETVYVIADAEGKAKKVIVSDWLKNPDKAKHLNDRSDLKDIENVEGNETYSINKDNMKVWEANGKDIYYQGTTDKSLPVDLTVSYKLDGKNVSAKELAGKSGKVTIRFDYKNNEYENVTIDGKQQRIYVPFVMMTGTVLDNKNFKNVNVTNGKLINDGGKSIVMGYAMPGLQENLGVSKSQVDIPSYVEITADVEKFKLATTMTMATNEMFNNLDLSNIKSADDLKSKINTFVDSAQQLADGSSKLYDGLTTLMSKSDTLVKGIGQLQTGSQQLANGTSLFTNGTEELKAGIGQLNNGLYQLSSNSDQLNDGAGQVFDVLLATTGKQIQVAAEPLGITVPALTKDNYGTVIDNVIAGFTSDATVGNIKALIEAEVGKNTDKITAGVTEVVKQEIANGIKAAYPNIPEENLNAMVNAKLQDPQIEAKIKGIVSQKTAELVDSKLNEKKAELDAGVKQLQGAKEQLDSYNKFYTGVLQYTAGVQQVYQGSEKLFAGSKELAAKSVELNNGANQLNDGIGTLKDGSNKLVDGVAQLQSGSKTLSEGMNKFNEEGVKKIASLLDGDLLNIGTRLRATADVSKHYTNFSGIEKGTEGTVKFVYKTDEIQQKKEK